MTEPDRQRIFHIKAYCEDISDFIKRFGENFDVFITDRAYYNSVAMCVLQIGELANTLTEDFRISTENDIPWRMIRGMRNWLAHAYGEIDETILWETITNEIPVLLDFCNKTLKINSE